MPVGASSRSLICAISADRGLAGERVYLKGQFVRELHRTPIAAVCARKNRLDRCRSKRPAAAEPPLIGDFPAGYTPPARGAT